MSRGFAPIIFVIIIAVFGVVAVFAFKTINDFKFSGDTKPVESGSLVASPSATISLDSLPTVSLNLKTNKTLTPTATLTTVPSKAPTITSTQASSSDNSCSYDLSGPTGAVQVKINPSSGSVVGDQTVELQAKSGCKILDGRSTDKDSRVARAGGNGYSSQNSVSFSTVPAGNYSIRIQYKGQWSGYKSVDVVSMQNKTVEFLVDGENPPSTPTPPKSTCGVEVPSVSGTDPLTVTLTYSAHYVGDKNVAGAQWDFDGNGSWDTDMSVYNSNFSHTFPSASTYNVKLQLKMSDGEMTDICSKNVTVTSGQ